MIAFDAPANCDVPLSLQISERIDSLASIHCFDEEVKGGRQIPGTEVTSGDLQHAALSQARSGRVGNPHEITLHCADNSVACGDQR
jgi:hypothetical protein